MAYSRSWQQGRFDMKDPMIKRIPRELRRDIGKYTALFLFLTVLIGFISGFIVGDESLKARFDTSYDDFNVEDGHFILEKKASDRMIKAIEEEGTTVFPLFYKEETVASDNKAADGDEVRIFKLRDKVDLTALWAGREPETDSEVSIDRLYAKNNGISIGDTITLGGTEFTVTGYSALSDYTSLFINNSDTMFDATDFTTALVTDQGFSRVRNRHLKYCYAWVNDDRSLDDNARHDQEENVKDALIDATMDEMVLDPDVGSLFSVITDSIDESIESAWDKDSGSDDDDSELMEGMFVTLNEIEDFVPWSSNQAIQFAGDDMGSDRVMMITLLYIVIVIMAFVFGITVKSTIEKEAKAIGTLRASGYSRNEMFRHYIILPVLVTLTAALAGNVMGYTFMKTVCANMYLHSYSLLPYKTLWSFNAFRDTTVIPLLIIFAVIYLVTSRELMCPPREFLRGGSQVKSRKHSLILKRGSFISRYRKRVLMLNLPSYLVMFIGILFSVIIMLFCLGMLPLLRNYENIIMESNMAEYQYFLKEPVRVKSDSAEKYQMNVLKNDDERGEDITVYGISDDSMYLSDLDLEKGSTDVIISSAYAKKYKLKEGSTFSLKEEYKKKKYTFRIKDIYDYEAQLCVFMNIDSFNSIFGFGRNEYAGYLSDQELGEIPESKVATILTKEDLATISKQLDSSMGGIFELFSIFGVVIFIIVIYLLSKVLIEKNARSIAMSKILGYSDGEISSIYNRVTMLVVVTSLILSLPIGYYIFALVFQIMIFFYTGWLTYYMAPVVYVKTFVIGIASYYIVHLLQLRRIRKIPMGEVLKGME